VIRALVAVLVATALAAGEPALEWSVDRSQIAVGDSVVATLVQRWPAGWEPVGDPDPSPDLAGVFVADLPPAEVLDGGGERHRRWRITLVAVRSGAWALPRPELRLRSATGALVTVTAPALTVQVGPEALPVRLPATRALWTRPPAGIAHSPWPWIAGGLVLLAGIGALIWWRRRRAAPPVPLIDRTRAALAAALAQPDTRAAASAVSLALRRHAGAVWDFDGAGATAREVAALLRRLGDAVPEEERRELLRILDGLDGLRWAPGDLDPERVRPWAESGRRWAEGVHDRLTQAAAVAGGR
jgi:hypothetical protein